MAVQNKRRGYGFAGHDEQNRSDVPGRRRNRQHSYQESKSIERLHVENKGQHEGERNRTPDTRQDPDNEPDDDAEEEEEKGGKSKRLYEAGKKCVKHCAIYFSGGSGRFTCQGLKLFAILAKNRRGQIASLRACPLLQGFFEFID